jgi:endonuclease-3
MNNDEQLQIITQKLLAFGATVSVNELLPTVIPDAAPLVNTDPYAFAIATCLDRGTKAEIIWTIPYYIKNDLGHLDPHRIYKMSLDELAALFARLPQRPRYVNDAPKTIHGLTRIVVEECDGDAFNLWKGKRAAEVKRILMSIHGVGPGITNMGVLLIEKTFGVRFNDLDRTRMDIKPDTHTVRVLYRLGVSEAKTTDSAIAATRRMNPEFPGGVDGALWAIGRRFCFASDPNCLECPMNSICAKQMT